MENTYAAVPEVNERLANLVNIIKHGLVNAFKPRSIILSGSFGRGEVTASIKNNSLELLSDCEINLVTNKYISQSAVVKLTREIADNFGMDISIRGTLISLYLLLGIQNSMKPTIQNYDLKYGSKTIYGTDYLPKIPSFKQEELPFWEGIRLMFNRMAECLEYNITNNGTGPKFIFRLYKLVLACQDTLLLSNHLYDTSYRTRNILFQRIFTECFPELSQELPYALQLAEGATEFKLTGKSIYNNEADIHIKTKKMCDSVFRFAIRKYMGIEFGNYIDFYDLYLHKRKNIMGEGLFTYLVQNSYRLAELALVNRSYIPNGFILQIHRPSRQITYSLIPLAFFALCPDGKINKSYIGKLREELSLYFKLEKEAESELAEYKYLNKLVIQLWKTYC